MEGEGLASGGTDMVAGDAAAMPPPPDPFGGPDAIRTTYTMTVSDIRRGATSLSRHSVGTNAVGFALALTGLFTIFANGDLFGLLVGGLGVLFLTGHAAGLIAGFMASRRADLLREPVSLTVTGDGVRTVMRSMSGEARWSSYKRVRISGPSLVMELGTGPAVIIPTRAFDPAQLERVRGWAAVAGVLDSSSPERAYGLGFLLGLAFNAVIFAAVVVAANR